MLYLISFGKSHSSSLWGQKVFLGLITKRIGYEKMKAEKIINLLRNFYSKGSANTFSDCAESRGLCLLSQHNLYFTVNDLKEDVVSWEDFIEPDKWYSHESSNIIVMP